MIQNLFRHNLHGWKYLNKRKINHDQNLTMCWQGVIFATKNNIVNQLTIFAVNFGKLCRRERHGVARQVLAFDLEGGEMAAANPAVRFRLPFFPGSLCCEFNPFRPSVILRKSEEFFRTIFICIRTRFHTTRCKAHDVMMLWWGLFW